MARTTRLSIALAAILGAVLVAPMPAAHAAAANKAAGIGTKAALENPNCDPETGRVRIPAYLASVCVREWKDGGNNGGATSQGVTKDSIRVVVYVAPDDVQLAGTGATNQATNSPGLIQDSMVDTQQIFEKYYETWGRDVQLEFFTRTGTDEASQRADALAVAARKPFAVINSAGGSVFSTDIAARKIVVPFGAGSQKENLAQQPYRYTGQDADLQAANVAAFLGKALAGHKAQWAGDANLKSQTRKFGVIYQSSVVTGPEFDIDRFNALLAKYKVPKPVATVSYTAPADSGQSSAQLQQQVPTLAAKLKDAGATSVVLLVGSSVVGPLTNAATSLNWHPEWVMTGWAYQELSLWTSSTYANHYDLDQWKNAFGMSWFAPYASGNAGAVTAQNVFTWYWGDNKGTTSSGAVPAIYFLYQGIHLAGPKLTPESFRDGQFAQPGSGGAFQDQVTTQGNKVGDIGLGYPEYALLGPKDFALVWWDPTAKGLGNILGSEQTGNYQYLEGGKRYTLETWKPGEPKFFTSDPGNVVYFTAPPEGEAPKPYPCTGCPSQGGAGTPSTVRA